MPSKYFERFTAIWSSWDREEARVSAFLHTILLLILAGCAAMFVIMVITAATGSTPEVGYTLVVIASLAGTALILLVLNRRGYTQAASIILVVMLWFIITIMCARVDGTFDVAVMTYFMVTAVSGLLLGRYAVLGSALLNLAGIAILAVVKPYPTKLLLLFPSDRVFRPVASGLIIVVTSIVFFLAIYNVRTAVRHAQRELNERKRAEEAEREQRRLAEALRDTAAALSASLNPDEVLDRVMENLQNVLPHDSTVVALLEGDEVRVVRRRAYGDQPVAPEMLPKRLLLKDTRYLKHVVDSDEPILIPDVKQDPNYVRYEGVDWFRAYAAIPIRVEGRIIGFINLLSHEAGQFTPAHTDRLQAFADQAAIAIQNARLYSELEGYNLRLQQTVSEATKELSDAKEQLETLVDNSPDAILLLNPDGQILAANPAFETMFGYQANTVKGEPISRFMGGGNNPALQQALQNIRESRQWSRLEVTACARDGSTFDAEIALAPVPGDQHGARVVCNLRDISPLKQVERIKDSFVSTAAHELRTPLTSILGYSEILIERELSGDRRLRYLKTINQQAAQLKSIIDDMLDLSRLEAGQGLDIKPEPIHVDEIVDASLEPFMDTTSNHDFRRIRPAESPIVRGDAFRLTQVIRNIISNAIKYSPDGGTITIETATLPGAVRVSVADEGIGIAPDQLEHIFERFYRAQGADRMAAGTGLGLAISKLIVEAHGGAITASSEVGAGTTFTFTLPRVGLTPPHEGPESA
jgi:PAS domain S-box-containing protein